MQRDRGKFNKKRPEEKKINYTYISEDEVEVRVSGASNANSTGSFISGCINKRLKVSTVAIGPWAVNQMYKALAIARKNVASTGRDLVVRPGFETVALESISDKNSLEEGIRMVGRVSTE